MQIRNGIANDKEWLIEMNHNQQKSISEMSKLAKVSYQAIRQNMKKYGIEIRKYKCVRNKTRKYQLNENYFAVIDTEDKAYWLGFILADGSIIQTKKNRPDQLKLAFNLQLNDKEILEKLLICLESNIPIRIKTTRSMQVLNYSNKITRIKESKVADLQVNSSQLCHDLVRHGITQRKTLQETPPNLPDHLVSHFIRGFFDGDGCFSIVSPTNRKNSYPRVFIASGEEIINYIVDEVAKHLDIEMGTSKQGKLSRCHLQNRSDIEIFMDWIYKDAKIYLERKYQAYQAYLTKI